MAETLGLMTLERWVALFNAGQYIRIFLDGDNVTTMCLSADDRTGWVLLEVPSFRTKEPQLLTGTVHYDVIELRREGVRGARA